MRNILKAAFRALLCKLVRVRPYTRDEHLALSGLMSNEWLRQHSEAARAADYVLIDGKLYL